MQYLINQFNQTQGPDRIGLIGLYLFAFCAWLGTAGAYLGLLLMLGAFVANIKTAWPIIRREPLFILCAISIPWLIIQAWLAAREFPETAAMQQDQTSAWLQLWLFLLVAWWLKGDQTRITTFLTLAVAGLVLAMLKNVQWSHLEIYLQGIKTGFGFQVIAFGLMTGTALMGLLIFAEKIYTQSKSRSHFLIKIVAWSLATFLMMTGLIMAQSRAAWIAVAVVLPVVLTIQYGGRLKRQGMKGLAKASITIGFALVILAVPIALNKSEIEKRISAEQETFEALTSSNLESIPMTSVGIRINLYALALQRWMERPLLGWGPGSSNLLIKQSEKQPLPLYKHFHNSYLDVLARFGLLGAIALVLIMLLLCRSIYRAPQAKQVAPEIVLFSTGSLAMLALWSLSDTQISSTDWRFYWLIIGGVAYSFILRQKTKDEIHN